MTPAGLRVPRVRGEEVREALRSAGLLDLSRAIRREPEHLVLPLRAIPPRASEWGEIVDREFDVLERASPSDYRELLDWSPERKARLPRSFDVIGDIVLVRLPEELDPYRGEVGEALLAFVPSARLVGVDRGVKGPERRREVERIAGEGSWRTWHRENGLRFAVDVSRAYFSPRLAREHERVASEVREGDRVYDLACGVGPFAVTIARDGRARTVTAVDRNPEAISLLSRTLARCSFGGRVSAFATSLESFLPGAAPCDRVVFNLPLEGIKYLPSVARAVAPHGRLYYYAVTPRDDRGSQAEAIVDALGATENWTVEGHHVVHPYSPAADLSAFVLARSER